MGIQVQNARACSEALATYRFLSSFDRDGTLSFAVLQRHNYWNSSLLLTHLVHDVSPQHASTTPSTQGHARERRP